MHTLTRPLLAALALALALALAASSATADVRLPAVDHPLWREECGSCHLAYPPGLLPAASWEQMMGRLDRHFGSNASLDPRSQQQITAFLRQHAATSGKPARQESERISTTPWFTREHSRALARTGVPAARCESCHTDAQQGRFAEDAIRLPRETGR